MKIYIDKLVKGVVVMVTFYNFIRRRVESSEVGSVWCLDFAEGLLVLGCHSGPSFLNHLVFFRIFCISLINYVDQYFVTVSRLVQSGSVSWSFHDKTFRINLYLKNIHIFSIKKPL
jgi:hypothetical protein